MENGANTVVCHLEILENFVVCVWDRKKCILFLNTILENKIIYSDKRKQADEPLAGCW